MSKSVEGSYINITDDLETIKKKIRSVPTASVAGGEMSQGVKMLFELLKLFVPEEMVQFMHKYDDGSLKFVELKDYLSEAIFAELQPIQNKRKELEADKEYVDRVIREGAEKARVEARKTILEVKQKMGLL